jgi:hypothetical protein
MRILTFVCLALICPSLFAGNYDSVKHEIVEAVLRNFDACNREDIDEVMNSCADAMPRREEFKKETLKVFEEKDIHYSLIDLEVLEVKGSFALVKMVQKSHIDDRDSENKDLIGYRNQTGLVTKEECVEYLNTLKREKGVWKLLSIVSEMRPVKSERQEQEEEDEPKCVNGTCRPTPFNVQNTLIKQGFKPPQR